MTRLRPLADPGHLPALNRSFVIDRPALGLGAVGFCGLADVAGSPGLLQNVLVQSSGRVISAETLYRARGGPI